MYSNLTSQVYLFSFRKSFRKTNKNNKRPRKKQIEALKVLKPLDQKLTVKNSFPKDQLNEKDKNELVKRIKKWKK